MVNEFVTVGVVLIIAGFIVLVIGSLMGGETKIGVGGFIGPIPLGFANDPKMLWIIVALTVVLIIASYLR